MSEEDRRRFGEVGGYDQALRSLAHPAAGNCAHCAAPIEEMTLFESVAGGGHREVRVLIHSATGLTPCQLYATRAAGEDLPAGTPSSGPLSPGGDGNLPAYGGEDLPVEASTEHPVAKVATDDGFATRLFMITCDEGWRSHIVATHLYEHVADWLLGILGRHPFAEGH